MRFIMVAAAALLINAPALACTASTVRTFTGHTLDGTMTVKSGRPCSVAVIWSRGPTQTVEVVRRPSNGTITQTGAHRLVYRSRPGFTGSDSFSYTRRGLDTRNNAIAYTVRRAVTVTP